MTSQGVPGSPTGEGVGTERAWPSRTPSLSVVLFSGVFLFLTVQLPWTSSNADVYDRAAFAAGADAPALNYHIGQTALLWLVYRAAPLSLRQTLWPAGLLSALAVALAIAATFALWRRLGMTRLDACAVAIAALLIPSIWYHGTIGEVYGLQLCFSVLFALFFVDRKLVWAALFFLGAILVSPLAIFAAPLVLLARGQTHVLRDAVLVGALSSVLYLPVLLLIGSSVETGFSEVHSPPQGWMMAVAERTLRLGVILGANLGGYLPWLLLGARPFRRLPQFAALSVIALSQLILPTLDRQFLVELGSFQLLLWWVVAVPLGLGLVKLGTSRSVLAALLVGVGVTSGLWLLPNARVGKVLEETGAELRGRFVRPMILVGPWNETWPIALAFYRWDYVTAARHFHETTRASSSELSRLGAEEALLVVRRGGVRARLARILPTYVHEESLIDEDLARSLPPAVLANEEVAVYQWKPR